MAHTLQERYSDLTLIKIRAALVLKPGIVFNENYEGSPKAGAVKIPVRDTEVQVSDYDKANGIAPNMGSTVYTTLTIDQDKAINEIIDGYDAEAVPDNLVADRIDSGGYSIAYNQDIHMGGVILDAATKSYLGSVTKDNIYGKLVAARTAMSKANIPFDRKRYVLATPDAMALILESPHFTGASDLEDQFKQEGVVGRIAGFNVIEWNTDEENLLFVAGHPDYVTRAQEFAVDVHLQDLAGSGKYIGASAVQGRIVYGDKVLRSVAFTAYYSGSNPNPNPPAIEVTLPTASADLFGKHASDIQYGDIAVVNDEAITGTVKYVSGWTAFSPGNVDWQSGNFLAVHIKASNVDKVEVKFDPSERPVATQWVEIPGGEDDLVVRIVDPRISKILIRVTVGDVVTTKEYGLSGITCDPKP